MIWVLVVLIDAAVFLPGALYYDRVLHAVCPSPRTVAAANCAPGQLTSSAMRHFMHLGLSLDLYAVLIVAVCVLASVIFFVIGALIAYRKWSEGMGILTSLILITIGASGAGAVFRTVAQQTLPSLAPWLAAILTAAAIPIFILQWPALGAFLLTFPTGRFAPRWTWILVGLWITNFFAFILRPGHVVTFFSVVVTFSSVVVVQVYHYRRIYGAVERQQTKWVLYMLAVAVAVDIAFDGILAVSSGASHDAGRQFTLSALNAISGAITFLLMGSGVAIALLRYRLYDIDVIINRTLVYGSATVSLGALYVGGVIALQALFGHLTGQSSGVAIAIATLAFAALFTPWRRRLQTFIDRRFYRRKYDAARTLAEFQTQLRDQVDLDRLSGDLVGVVQETMQPANIALWLAPAGQ